MALSVSNAADHNQHEWEFFKACIQSHIESCGATRNTDLLDDVLLRLKCLNNEQAWAIVTQETTSFIDQLNSMRDVIFEDMQVINVSTKQRNYGNPPAINFVKKDIDSSFVDDMETDVEFADYGLCLQQVYVYLSFKFFY
jgi:hypothetical protein